MTARRTVWVDISTPANPDTYVKVGAWAFTDPAGDLDGHGFVLRGVWSDQTAYAPFDVVDYAGDEWLSVRASTGVTPSDANPLDWALWSANGVPADVDDLSAYDLITARAAALAAEVVRADAAYEPIGGGGTGSGVYTNDIDPLDTLGPNALWLDTSTQPAPTLFCRTAANDGWRGIF